MYIMRTHLQDRPDYESKPAIGASDDATESHLVLLALRDALYRIRYACDVVIHTECSYVAAAVNNMWPVAWQENGWRNARGQQVKDTNLWKDILQELDETGHVFRAVPGKHEFCDWMRNNMPHLAADKMSFTAVEQKVVNLVSDRMES